MSDARGDPLPKSTAHAPAEPRPVTSVEDDAINLLDGSVEPTDDAPTVISKSIQAAGVTRSDEPNLSGIRGRQLAHFELIEPIGVGGMAAVLRARDTQLDRLVALKILPPEMAADAENVRRFHQEARSAARLDHENIARVFYCGEDQRLHFIAFEFVEGENLRTVLEKRGRLPVGEALHYMLQVAAGLAHAARRGVVHRDIKPSNIIITPNGRAKLVDMGLARSMETQHDMGLTQSGVTLGTFDYISPEQALEPREADVRSDIYSLGCTFYHMLTGQAPVPEGTAAKKLHHHQHIKPVDPRQFVADLPDEVAAILDRMMAKQPKDRYQTPEHLVHHLYLAARKLDVVADVPEGVLTVEAALPNPPAIRPIVLIALAAIAVVGLILLADPTPSSKPERTQQSLADSRQTDPNKEPSSSKSPVVAQPGGEEKTTKAVDTLKKPPTVPTFRKEKNTAADVLEFVRQNQQAEEICLMLDDLDLRFIGADLVIPNKRVTIKPRTPGQRPTVRDHYRDRPGLARQASLIIQSKICDVEDIRFVLDQSAASVPMAMLWLRGTDKARIHGCEFIQANPTYDRDKSRMASILVESPGEASLEVARSCFLGFGSLSTTGEEQLEFSRAASGGQDAITRRGPVQLDVTNCVFGPHAATFRLEGPTPTKTGRVHLTHCSVQTASQSAVFDVAETANAHIETSASLFSLPGETNMTGMVEGKGAVLLRLDPTRGEVSYQGRENRYHQLDHYVVIADAPEETTQRLLSELRQTDDLRELDTSPWKDPRPVSQLEQLAIRKAFEVNPLLPELRLPSPQKSSDQLIGAEYVLSFSYVKDLPSLKASPTAPASRELVVEKRDKPDHEKKLYPSLKYALLDAQPGDVIRLKLNGEIRVDPVVLKEKSADVTIRADAGFHPVLTLADTEDGDSPALFELHNGKLRLEGLEIRLPTRRKETEWCAMITFQGDGECILKGCLVTLERAGRKTALAVVPEKRLKKQYPRLQLEQCFIRGQGDLIWFEGGHAAELSVENSLIALGGSLVNVVTEKEKDQLPTNGSLTVRLRKVTTYLGGNLLRVRAAKEIKSLAQMRYDAEECLFLPASDQALVRLEGPEEEERGLREKFAWESSGKNAYGSFTNMVVQQCGDSMKMPIPTNQDTWKKEVSSENGSDYNVKLPNPPAADASFTQLLPPSFRPPDILKEYGVDLTSLRALPAMRTKVERQDADLDFPDFDTE